MRPHIRAIARIAVSMVLRIPSPQDRPVRALLRVARCPYFTVPSRPSPILGASWENAVNRSRGKLVAGGACGRPPELLSSVQASPTLYVGGRFFVAEP